MKSKELDIRNLSDTLKQIMDSVHGLVLSIEGLRTKLFIDKETLRRATFYGDKACFNYITSVGKISKPLTQEEYNALANSELDYGALDIKRKK